jgi:hypothetical protein
MPCHPVKYPEQTEIEKEIIKILSIQDELEGEQKVYSYSHPRINDYELNQETLDELIIALCLELQNLKEIYKYSDKVIDWWNSHQINDFNNLNRKLRNSSSNSEFIDSLNVHEQNIINLKILIYDIVQQQAASTKWKLQNNNDPKRRLLILNNQFLRLTHLLYCITSIESEENLYFIPWEIKSFEKGKLEVLINKNFNSSIPKIIEEAIHIHNNLGDSANEHNDILRPILMANEKPITEMFVLNLTDSIEKTVHNNGYKA